jgi:P27 family predicted phage terminase small subunit
MAETIPARPLRGSPARTIEIMPKAPKHLSKESRALYETITEKWILGPDGLAILRGALECRDAYEVCRAQVAKDGPTFKSATGRICQHPATKLSLDYFAQFRMGMRQLGLDPEK